MLAPSVCYKDRTNHKNTSFLLQDLALQLPHETHLRNEAWQESVPDC